MEQSPHSRAYNFTLQQIKGNIEPENAYNLIQKNKKNSDFIIIDMRTQSEFSNGHIENAVNLDSTSDDFKLRLEELNKN
jgi:rhodanese-related sulfurtransferase